MDFFNAIQENLTGSGDELARRGELLTAVTAAYERGGPDAVTEELKTRIRQLEQIVTRKLSALDTILA